MGDISDSKQIPVDSNDAKIYSLLNRGLCSNIKAGFQKSEGLIVFTKII